MITSIIRGVHDKYQNFATEMEVEAAKDKLWRMGYPFGLQSVLEREGKLMVKSGQIQSYKNIEVWEEGVKLLGSMTVVNFDGEERDFDIEFDYTKDRHGCLGS